MALDKFKIPSNVTVAVRVDKFRDARDPANVAVDPDEPVAFLDAATTAEFQVTNVSDPDAPAAIGSPVTLIADGSGGGYGGDIAHDFESNALVPGMRITIVSTLEEGAVHWETPHDDQNFVVT